MRYIHSALLASTALRAPEDGGGAEPSSISVEVAGQAKPTTAVEFGRDGKAKPAERSGEGSSANFTQGEVTTRDLDAEPPEADANDKDADEPEVGEGDAAEKPAEGDEAGAEPDKDAVAEEALPEFDAEKPEVIEAYDGRYFKDVDGKPTLDIDKLGEVVYANSQKTDDKGNIIGKPELNAGEYAWLEARLGVTREQADETIAGRIALKQQKETAFYTSVGGKDNWDGVLAFAKEKNLYKPEQKAKFNAALKAGGDEAMEQIELLFARAEKAGYRGAGPKPDPKVAQKPASLLGAPRAKKPASPQKSASGAEVRQAGGLKPFENNDEYVAALRAAGTDKAKVEEARKRLAASTYWRPGRKG